MKSCMRESQQSASVVIEMCREHYTKKRSKGEHLRYTDRRGWSGTSGRMNTWPRGKGKATQLE